VHHEDVSSVDSWDIGKETAPKEDDWGSSRREDRDNRKIVSHIDRLRVDPWCKEQC